MKTPLLLTRPKEGSDELAAALDTHFPGRFRTIFTPLLEIASEDAFIQMEGVQAVLFSSATAVREFAARSADRHIPALCVGDKTAATAQACGFPAQSASGDAAALAELAATSYLEGAGHFLYPRGRQTTGDVAGSLSAQGIFVDEVILYHQRPCPLSDEAKAVLNAPHEVIVPVFSPNTGLRLAEDLAALPTRQAPLLIVAISGNAATACTGIRDAETFVAAHPSSEGVLAALAEL